MSRVAKFVILTVRQPLSRIQDNLAELEATGSDSSLLWAWKHQAYLDCGERMVARFAACEALYNCHANPDIIADEILAYVATWHGFGFPKAGFFLQLVYGLSGCLDSHNLARYGIPGSITRTCKTHKPATFQRRAHAYNLVIKKLGGTEYLWDNWCEYVAEREGLNGKGLTAYDVSKMHVDALRIGELKWK